jgi:hypothetical protein
MRNMLNDKQQAIGCVIFLHLMSFMFLLSNFRPPIL